MDDPSDPKEDRPGRDVGPQGLEVGAGNPPAASRPAGASGKHRDPYDTALGGPGLPHDFASAPAPLAMPRDPYDTGPSPRRDPYDTANAPATFAMPRDPYAYGFRGLPTGQGSRTPNGAGSLRDPYLTDRASEAGTGGASPAPGGGATSAPLRVIHVGPCLTRGGAEQWLIELTRFLDPGRVRVLRTIVTRPDRVDPRFVDDLPIPVEAGQAESVRRAARECDVLMGWGIPLDDWLADCPPKLCVFVAHGDGPWTKMLMERNARVVDHVVAVSHRVRRLVCDGLPTTVIYNGIDSLRLARTRSRDAVRRSLGFAPGDFVLGYVGRLSAEKRPQVLIEALAGLPPQFKALIVGWGPLRPALLEAANRLIPGRHAFVNATDYLGDYYQAMDAFCLLGTEEGFSLAMLEAMMCERPVVATPVGSVPEVVVDRVNGLVVDGTVAQVRAAVELLHRHPAWARGLAAEALVFAEQHGHAARMARDYEHLLESLWAGRNGHGNGHHRATRPAGGPVAW